MNHYSSLSLKTILTEAKISIRLALPLIASFLVQQSSGFAVTTMIAHLGHDTLAASPLAWSVYSFAWMLSIGLYQAICIMVAHSFGAKDPKGIGLAVSQGFLLSLLFTIPTMSLMWIASIWFRFSGQNATIVNIAARFVHDLSWCVIPISIYEVMEQFLIGIGKTRLVLVVSLLQVPAAILLNYALIFGKWGLPKFGIYGAAYGYFIIFSLVALFLGLFLYFSKYSQRYFIFSYLNQIRWKFFWELIRVGFPIGCTYIIEVGILAIITLLMGHFSSDELAAHQIALQFLGISFVIMLALGQVTSMRAGYAVGQNNRFGIKLSTYVNTIIGLMILGIIGFFYLVFPQWMLSIDISAAMQNYQVVSHYAIIFIGISVLILIFDNIRLNFMGGLRSLKDTRFPMIVSAIGFLGVVLALAYVLAFYFQLKGVGLWIASTSGSAFCALILVIRFIKQVNRLDLTKLVTLSDQQ